jgi:hypothetical protein
LRDYLDHISILVIKSVNRSIKAESEKLEFLQTQPIPTNTKQILSEFSEFSGSMTDQIQSTETNLGKIALKLATAKLTKRGVPLASNVIASVEEFLTQVASQSPARWRARPLRRNPGWPRRRPPLPRPCKTSATNSSQMRRRRIWRTPGARATP